MSVYIELSIPVTDNNQKEILIAQLEAQGAEGFEEGISFLKVFVRSEDFVKSEFEKIIYQHQLNYTSLVIEEKNWNAEWESNFQPVIIDEFCVIRAHFHSAVPGIKHDIIITPKMSFGTGHHATTYMMVQAMSGLDVRNRSVFDFGTGTGVLAILAEKMGASAVTAIDNDEWSIENSEENFNRNNCSKILLINDKEMTGRNQFDIIIANINRNIILRNLNNIKQHLSPTGVLLLSGLLSGDQPIIMEEAEKNHLKLNNRLEKNGWICLQLINA